jgi:HlyD family secretion protein
LAGIKYGQNVRLRLDDGSKAGVFLPAAVSWIGHEAEFSPKNIQTRESRNELVFRVRALAPNKDGMLKRGLPVEVWK